MTVNSTKRPIMHARILSWKSLMKHGTRSSRTLTHFTQTWRPSNSWPSHRVMFGPSHHRCGGYTSSNEDSLKRLWRDPTSYKYNGSSAAQIQARKTHHLWRVYARCGAKIAILIRWVRNRDTGVVETPRRQTNLVRTENGFLGGLRCEAMRRGCQGRGRKTFLWFRSIWSGTWKIQRATTEAKTSKDSGESPLSQIKWCTHWRYI